MSADLATSRVLPGTLFKLHVECEREIDFDFFDDAPASAASSVTWASPSPSSRLTDDGHGGDGDGNAPSPMLTGGPTPSASAAASCLSLPSASTLPDDTTSEDEDGADDFIEECAEDDDEDCAEDVVVGPTPAAREPAPVTPVTAVVDDAPAPAPRPPTDGEDGELEAANVAAADSIAGNTGDPGLPPAASTPPSTVPGPDGADEAPPPLLDATAGAVGTPPTECSADDDVYAEDFSSESEDSAEEAAVAFGIQELTLTVSTRGARATSSITTVTSVSGGSSRRRDSSEQDTDVEDTIEAIAKALSRKRPPSSTGSLPTPSTSTAAGRRPGRSRRLNMSFSNEEARRIQRENELLLRRIVGQRARPPSLPTAASRTAPAAPAAAHRCSHAVNRARRGRDIERENQILLRKIQSVKRSPSQLSMSRSSSAMSGRYSCG